MVAIVFNHLGYDDNSLLLNMSPFVQVHPNRLQAIEKLESWGYTRQENTQGFDMFIKGKVKDGIFYRVLANVVEIADYRSNSMIIMLEDLGPKGEVTDEEN